MRTSIVASVLVLMVACGLGDTASASADESSDLVFATCVSGLHQARKAEVMVDSIRTFGGTYKDAPIYVVVDEDAGAATLGLRRDGVVVLPLQIPEVARDFLFANKVYAAAQVEAMVEDAAHSLVWMDPETLVLNPPQALDLGAEGPVVAMRPVFLVNRIGLAPDAEVDGFWSGVFAETGADPEQVPIVEAFVRSEPIRFYINCGIISYRPSRGICREWARAFTALLEDSEYRHQHAAHMLNRVFLHQSVVSAVILARSQPGEWRWLPPDHGYPLGQHPNLPEEKKAPLLDDLACLIHDSLWDERPDWLTVIEVGEELRSWLERAYHSSLRVSDRIYREEGQCNSYLVTTAAGNVLIDPGGTSRDGSALRQIQGENAPAAILLTHGHADHRTGIADWRGEEEVPVVGQRRHEELLQDQHRMAGFLARRNAIISGQPIADDSQPAEMPEVEVTVFFDQEHSIEVGDLHFELVHTPGETPDTSTIWIPELGAVFTADNFYSDFPNLATPRGAEPRWAMDYVRAMDHALALEPELLLPGHGVPIVGRELVRQRLTDYRDAILWVHDAAVKGLNDGKSIDTLVAEIELPGRFSIGEAFGTVDYAVRGIAQQYTGWFDGRTASLFSLPATAAYEELVGLVGGAAAVNARARELLEADDGERALLLSDAAMAVEPDSREGLELRREILRYLFRHSRNYFQQRWLVDDFQRAGRRLQELAPAAESDG